MRRSTFAPRFPPDGDSMRTVLTRLLIAVLALHTAFGVSLHELAHAAQASHGLAVLSMMGHLDDDRASDSGPQESQESAGEAACAWCVTAAGQAALPVPLFVVSLPVAAVIANVCQTDGPRSGNVTRWCFGAREPPLQVS